MNEGEELRAGPIRAVFRDGSLRHLLIGDAEAVERIYGAVRDQFWNTPPGVLQNLSIQKSAESFTVTFDSLHRDGAVDFRWRGTITGDGNGAIKFAMDGKAHATFLRSRIGLCVHHPLRECAGQPCRIDLHNGTAEDLRFPRLISPHQPFRDIRAMTYRVGGGDVTLRFEGDVFETEDQRNWTDANFKTYSTPLSRPYPVEFAAGSEVRQAVELTLASAMPTQASTVRGRVTVRAQNALVPLPKLGLALAASDVPTSDEERAALRRLRLAHLRVDLPSGKDADAILARGAAEAQVLGARLEAALELPLDLTPLGKWSSMIDRFLVFSQGKKASGLEEARVVRKALGPRVPIAVGTNTYFAELNRNRPGGEGWDAACFSINPQVHANDDETVMSNAGAQCAAIETAKQFLAGRATVVSPVTLRPRFNPDKPDGPRPEPDPRQRLPFCAAWTVASLRALAEGGAAAATYYETHGAYGVLNGRELFPVYRIFAALAEEGATHIDLCASSDVSQIVAMAMQQRGGEDRRYLLANLTPHACEVELQGMGITNVPPYDVTDLREHRG